MLLPDDSFIQSTGGANLNSWKSPKSVFKIIKISSLDCGIADCGKLCQNRLHCLGEKGKFLPIVGTHYAITGMYS